MIMKRTFRWLAFVGTALGAHVAVADSFTGWPVDCRPSDVSRRIARQFLSTSPDYYCPTNGYRGNRGYGFGKEIQYSVVSLWINAMECARIIGDAELEKQLGIEAGHTTSDGKFTLEATRCLGCCGLAPVFVIDDEVYGRVTPSGIKPILDKYRD